MAVYADRALDARERPQKGIVSAESPRQARDELRAKGLVVEAIEPQAVAGRRTPALFRRRGRYESRLVPVIRELATLLSAAIPLAEALETIAQKERGVVGRSLTLVRDRVVAGAGLSEALREQPSLYDGT